LNGSSLLIHYRTPILCWQWLYLILLCSTLSQLSMPRQVPDA
jgi:hypothetical protein